MKNFYMGLAGLAAATMVAASALTTPASAFHYGGYNRPELVCLVTFFKRNQVAGGADVNVQRTQTLPRRVAEWRDGPHDRMRIFDYGSNRQTRETCRYLNRINN